MKLSHAQSTLETRALVAVLVGAFLWAQAAFSQSLAERGGLHQIVPGHYVYVHTDEAPGVSSTFNSGIVVTDDGVLVIDALSSEAIAREVRAAIAGITEQPIRYLVSSTFHGRYTGGNPVYDDVVSIGHEDYREDLRSLLEDGPAERLAASLPDQTYVDRMTLYLGGKEIQILHWGPAHTRGDTIVFVPEDRIVYMSEVFNHEEFPYSSDGYLGDWMRALEAAEQLEADIFVPGHGFLPDDPRATRRGLRAHWQILADVRSAVRREIDRGASEDEAVASIDFPEYQRFKGYSRAGELAIRRAYGELTAGRD